LQRKDDLQKSKRIKSQHDQYDSTDLEACQILCSQIHIQDKQSSIYTISPKHLQREKVNKEALTKYRVYASGINEIALDWR